MNVFNTILVLISAFLAVFWEAAFQGLRHLLGAQVDLLPPLMVYASLRGSFVTITLVSVLGGLWLDSLSANPLGISILPLFLVGLPIYLKRELILRDQPFAQFIMGLLASGIAATLTLGLLLTTAHHPLLGGGTLWQFAV